jgi:phosphatidate cytidylyltransferase
MIKQRVITASILAPLALGSVFLLPLSGFAVVMAFVLMIAAWEWGNFALYSRRMRALFVVLFGAVIALIYPFVAALTLPVLIVAALFWVFAITRVVRYPKTLGIDATLTKLLTGLLVLVPTWVAMVGLKAHESSDLLLLLLFLLVWGADIGAYFAGKRFGRVKLLPKVSPGKTREGVYGGMIAAMMISLGFSIVLGLSSTSIVLLLALSALVVLISVFGDLFESMFKRERGIKDSGVILPGHGGVLDRVDSLTAAAPLFLLGIQLLPIL